MIDEEMISGAGMVGNAAAGITVGLAVAAGAFPAALLFANVSAGADVV